METGLESKAPTPPPVIQCAAYLEPLSAGHWKHHFWLFMAARVLLTAHKPLFHIDGFIKNQPRPEQLRYQLKASASPAIQDEFA